MKKLTKKEKSIGAKALLEEIRKLHDPNDPVRFMEVCGTHTVAIFREGIRQLLPKGISLLSGPGCPVCVTDAHYIDKAITYAQHEDVILAIFGDMLKVPGTYSSLADEKAKGARVHIVYSPLEVLQLGRENPNKRIVFLAIGFETTIAILAATVELVYQSGLTNVFFLVSHKLVPPALRALSMETEHTVDGFLLPGHVSVIIGEEPYQFLADEFHIPCAIAGFDGLELLQAIASLLWQRREGVARVDNVYRSVVAKRGNPVAQQLFRKLYEVVDEEWRGIGVLPQSGLRLKTPYDCLDVEKMFPLDVPKVSQNTHGCQCGQVLQGKIQPNGCPLFGKACTPEHPIGACMVSVEGSCAAWYRYGMSSGGLTWTNESV